MVLVQMNWDSRWKAYLNGVPVTAGPDGLGQLDYAGGRTAGTGLFDRYEAEVLLQLVDYLPCLNNHFLGAAILRLPVHRPQQVPRFFIDQKDRAFAASHGGIAQAGHRVGDEPGFFLLVFFVIRFGRRGRGWRRVEFVELVFETRAERIGKQSVGLLRVGGHRVDSAFGQFAGQKLIQSAAHAEDVDRFHVPRGVVHGEQRRDGDG